MNNISKTSNAIEQVWQTVMNQFKEKNNKFKEKFGEKYPEEMLEINTLKEDREIIYNDYEIKREEIDKKINALYAKILNVDHLIGSVLDKSDEDNTYYLQIDEFKKIGEGIILYGKSVMATKDITIDDLKTKDIYFEFNYNNKDEIFVSFDNIPLLKTVPQEMFDNTMKIITAVL